MSVAYDIPQNSNYSTSRIPQRRTQTKWKHKFVRMASSFLDKIFIKAAIFIKNSPIPQAVAVSADYSIDTIQSLDDIFELRQKAVWIAQTAVEWGVLSSTILGQALIKAGVAYQKAGLEEMQIRQFLHYHHHLNSSIWPPGAFESDLETKEVYTQTENSQLLRRRRHQTQYHAPSFDDIYEDENSSQRSSENIRQISFLKLMFWPVVLPVSIVKYHLSNVIEPTQQAVAKKLIAHSHLIPPSFKVLLPSILPKKYSTMLQPITAIKPETIAQLNFGGHILQTSVDTLLSFPDSLLYQYFNFYLSHPLDEINPLRLFEWRGTEFYVDRSGIMFYYILEYLRYMKTEFQGNPRFPPFLLTCTQDYESLYDEAMFFKLYHLGECIKECRLEKEFRKYGNLYELWKVVNRWTLITFDTITNMYILRDTHRDVQEVFEEENRFVLTRANIQKLERNRTLFLFYVYFIYFCIMYIMFSIAI